ncbi:hypothetical protein [Leifsonia shinshuensis]|uniref:Uncharacterized protein n=1 Tax=Leifsonia shinshuensis TaxID=150026 RepID=A0A7G6YHD9_9MICO|nr:hypothetical protein [Leifsonia shinshuensis]QNE37904.1 hypothetical protein F1C12_21715 [Leifsonia shinshuensis]
MLTWVVATTRRLVFVGAGIWVVSAAIALLNPLTPQAIATPAATWPLWLSVPLAVVVVAVQFGSWAVAITLPIIGYALIVHGRPWRDTTRAPGRPERTRRATSATNTDSAVDDTVIDHTRITARSRRIIGA